MPEKTKLLIKPNARVWLSDSSRGALLGQIPTGVSVVEEMGEATTAAVFADDAASLKQTLARQKDNLGKPELLWVSYRKGNVGDLNRDTLWPLLTEYGMRPVTQVAIDDVWSALRFRALKPGEKWPSDR